MLFYSHPSSLDHDTGPGHPERRERMVALMAAVDAAALPDLVRREAPEATPEQIARAHSPDYVQEILAAVPERARRHVDPDTVLSPTSGPALLRGAGAVCAAVDAVIADEADTAFCAMRPPGHHAERLRPMGFCFFNNIAVGALQARHVHGVGRIAIFDFDVHHGNGTQDIFWDDPETLYISTHQAPLYPGTGAAEERGAHGNILNLPLRAGTGGQVFRDVCERSVFKAIDRFHPELIMLSAGFDAHRADPLASLMLEEEDFAWTTRQILALARTHARGRIVSVLEGGYDVQALGSCVVEHLKALGRE